jgi:hypothetical protein
VGASNGPRSCFVATSRWVTLFSICESCCCGCITGCVSAGNGHRKDAGGLRTGAHILWGAPVRPLRGANRGGGVLLGHGGRVQARYKMVNGCSARGDGDDMLSAMLVLACSGRHLISTPGRGTASRGNLQHQNQGRGRVSDFTFVFWASVDCAAGTLSCAGYRS